MGDTPDYLVTRTIPMAMTGKKQIEACLAELATIDAVRTATLNARGQLLLRYNAAAISLREIEQRLDRAGVVRPSGLFWRCKAAWYRYLDDNAKSNANAGKRDGACCNRPPHV